MGARQLAKPFSQFWNVDQGEFEAVFRSDSFYKLQQTNNGGWAGRDSFFFLLKKIYSSLLGVHISLMVLKTYFK